MSGFKRFLLLPALLLLAVCAGQEGITAGADNAPPDEGWVQTGGPAGGYINDLAMNPDNPEHLYAAGSSLGLYTTNNGGSSWTLLPFPEQNFVEEVEIDPHDPDTFFSTLFNFSRSDDGGDSWKSIMSGLDPGQEFHEILVDRFDTQVLYLAAQQQGVMLSTDGGTLYFGSAGAGVFRRSRYH